MQVSTGGTSKHARNRCVSELVNIDSSMECQFFLLRSHVLRVAAVRSLAVWAAIRIFLWVNSGNDLQLSAKSTVVLATVLHRAGVASLS